MSIEHPHMLWLLLLAAPVAAIGWRRMREVERVRRGAILAVRVVVIAAMVAMLAGFTKIRESDRLTVIALLDVSDSIRAFADLPAAPDQPGMSDLEYIRGWLRIANEDRRPDDRFGLVIFDRRPYALSTPTTARDYVDEPIDRRMEEGTDIAEAIRYGLAMFPPDSARRLLLISDGVSTQGQALEAAREAAGGGADWELDDSASRNNVGVPIDVAPIVYNVDREVMIERVEAPSNARPGQRITVRILIRSTVETLARLSLLLEETAVDINGAATGASRVVRLSPGLNVETASVELGELPVNRFRAIIEPATGADTLAGNNAAESFTITPRRGAVLILDGVTDGAARAGAVLPDMLREEGLFVSVVDPTGLPTNPLELQGYDLIILQNVAAEDVTATQRRLLLQFVEDLGGGLIMVGGYDSFGAGGWIDTEIDPILPVNPDLPEELRIPTAAIALVIDRSNSMAQPVLGSSESKQEIANEGAALAIESLDETDFVTVVAFSNSADVVVPIQRLSEDPTIPDQVRAISSSGGTNLYPGMEVAYRALRGVEADIKHVVCITDGQSQGGGFDQLAAQMRASGMTVSAIAVGDSADRATLQMIAEAGGGEFYWVRNPRILPRILLKDIRIVRRPMIRETDFAPLVLPSGSPITDGLTVAPRLGGVTLTSRRPDPMIQLLMETPEGEPLLAWWQVGLGRVAAFTSDAHANWASEWIDWPGYRQLWTQLARAISRPAGTREFELLTSIEEDELVITLDAREAEATSDEPLFLSVPGVVYTPAGEGVDVQLRQTGPFTYETRVPAPESGSYVVALSPRRGAEQLGLALGGVTRNTGLEYRRLASNARELQEISRITGGRLIDLEDPRQADLFRRENVAVARSFEPLWPVMLWITLALFILDVATRRIAWDWPSARRRASLLAAAFVAVARPRGEQEASTPGSLRRVTQRVDRRLREARAASSSGAVDEAERPLTPAAPVGDRTARDSASRVGDPAGGEAGSGRRPTRVETRDERSMNEAQAKSKPAPSAAERERQAVEARRRALDALKGRRSAPPPGSSASTTRSSEADRQPPDESSSLESPTSNLLAAKRRAREGFDHGPDEPET